MYVLSLLFLLPACYIFYVSVMWISQKITKNNRIHRTKKALLLLLLVIIALAFAHQIGFFLMRTESRPSFWLYSLLYFLALDIVAAYTFLVIKATNSRKNITKLLLYTIIGATFIPAGLWFYNVANLGVYDGKLGFSKQQAQKLVDTYIGPDLNNVFKEAKKDGDNWLISEGIKTKDLSYEVLIEYKVNQANGEVADTTGDRKVSLEIIKSTKVPADQVEVMLFADMAKEDDKQNWKAVNYNITDSFGKTVINMPDDTSNYHLMVKDCAFSCQDFYFKFKSPIKDSYQIILNPLSEQNIVEL